MENANKTKMNGGVKCSASLLLTSSSSLSKRSKFNTKPLNTFQRRKHNKKTIINLVAIIRVDIIIWDVALHDIFINACLLPLYCQHRTKKSENEKLLSILIVNARFVFVPPSRCLIRPIFRRLTLVKKGKIRKGKIRNRITRNKRIARKMKCRAVYRNSRFRVD